MLTRLTITRLRCLQQLELDLRAPVADGDGWTILVGPNGVGKTTILQSIVLAAIDPRAISAIVESPWTMVRSGAMEQGSIRLSFRHESEERVSERSLSGPLR